MDLRQRTVTALRGGKPDRVPFTCYAGLAPEGADQIENLLLVVTPPIYRLEGPEGEQTSRELGDGVTERTLRTAWGTLTQAGLTETGYGSWWTKEHWIKRPEDYRTVEQWVRHTRVVADPEPLRAARQGDLSRQHELVWTMRAPFQRLWIEYVGMEQLALDMQDCPEAVEGCLEALWDQSMEVMRCAAQSEAELVWVPDNITGEMTGPPLFRRYQAPYYEAICDLLLPAGKLPCCHMDGMLRQIADAIGETPLPVMEAFTPPPDGNLSVREARERWPGKALWLNFPSSVHLREPGEIERVTRELVAEAGDGGGFLVGITENMPPAVGCRSLQAIGRALA
jgi:hypothetical protein